MKLKAALLIFIILGLSYSMFQVFMKDSPKMLSEKEAEQIAADLYGGKVLNIEGDKGNSKYIVLIENDKGTYRLSVDKETKKVSDVKLIEKKAEKIAAEHKAEKSSATAANVKQNDIAPADPVPPPPISEQKAKEIALHALKEINGQVKGVTEVNIDKGKHYKITVEGKREGGEVLVQANTGTVSQIRNYSKKQPDPKPQQTVPPKKEEKPKQTVPLKSQEKPQQPAQKNVKTEDDDDDNDDDHNEEDDDDDD
ncbi:PepSY domain-containing protein [Metabacillus fastidiosus]|uniref:PepSY domain-containing protein n=1 Tax=Metabacillus fastidiosus TaxID=1458 RepID=UPI003D2856CF